MIKGPQKLAIGLFGEAAADEWRHFFEALSELYPVEFCEGRGKDGAVVFCENYEDATLLTPHGVPVYIALKNTNPHSLKPATHQIKFAATPSLDRCLQYQVMEDREMEAVFPLPRKDGDEVLASRDGKPVWVRRVRETITIELVGALPPLIGPRGYLCEYFRAGCFMRLLPLLVFLRRITAEVDWQSNGSQACFVFDSPSLYWTSYGFLDFRQLAEHAKKHNYCAAIATIPIDTWWMNPAAISIFRENAPRLSLLPHGNNHLNRELAQGSGGVSSIDILSQALGRLARLERQEGLEISRVMEAPHAAVSEGALRGMRELGFEGVLVTPELLLRSNPESAWPPALGLDRANFLGGGLPALPRIKMTRDWRTSVRLAAVLEQPILLAGQHEDAALGLELLTEYARTVNSAGNVTWASPKDILRSNWKQLRVGDDLHVRMYSRRIDFPIPQGVKQVWVHRPWVPDSGGDELLAVHCDQKQQSLARADGRVTGPIAVQEGKTTQIASVLKNPLDWRAAPRPAFKPWPVARKILMELRDRTRPLWPRKPAPGAGFAMYEKASPTQSPGLIP